MGAAGCVPGRPCRRWSARGPNPEPTDKVRRSAAPGILPARMPHVDAQKARARRGWGGGLPGLAWPRSSSWPGAVRARCVAVAGDLTLTRRRGVSWCADRQPAFPGTAGPPRWQIGRLAVLAAAAARAIRLSEAAGLMPGPARSAGGYRLCGPADLATLIRIRRCAGWALRSGRSGPSAGRGSRPILARRGRCCVRICCAASRRCAPPSRCSTACAPRSWPAGVRSTTRSPRRCRRRWLRRRPAGHAAGGAAAGAAGGAGP